MALNVQHTRVALSGGLWLLITLIYIDNLLIVLTMQIVSLYWFSQFFVDCYCEPITIILHSFPLSANADSSLPSLLYWLLRFQWTWFFVLLTSCSPYYLQIWDLQFIWSSTYYYFLVGFCAGFYTGFYTGLYTVFYTVFFFFHWLRRRQLTP